MDNDTKKPVPQEIIGALADAFGKSFLTIQRWFDSSDDRLTSDKAKKVYEEKGYKYEHANAEV